MRRRELLRLRAGALTLTTVGALRDRQARAARVKAKFDEMSRLPQLGR